MQQFKGIKRKPELLAGVEKTPTEGILEVRRPEIIAIPIYAIRVYGPFGLIQRHGAYDIGVLRWGQRINALCLKIDVVRFGHTLSHARKSNKTRTFF